MTDRLLLVGILKDIDIGKLLIMIEPEVWDPEFDRAGKDEHRKGLLTMKMAEGAKLQMCYLLHHLCDIQLRHRVEGIINFSHNFVGDLQTDQLRRWVGYSSSWSPLFKSSLILQIHRDKTIGSSECGGRQKDKGIPLSASRADERHFVL